MGLRQILAKVSQASAAITEVEQRRLLLNRPSEEEFLHWALDEDGPHLHGRFVPQSRRSRSVTSSGWCPGLRCDPEEFRRDG
ncbi:MAG: hypothetical protein QOG20_5027 [Pseudonocardiales bacterium]|nr:hypothetical protein [Pseudonocardiales bacterium]